MQKRQYKDTDRKDDRKILIENKYKENIIERYSES